MAASDLSLVVVTAVWGITFVVVKNALADIGPFWFIGIRFAIAFILLAAIYVPRLRRAWPGHTWIAGKVGVVLFFGFLFQTIGLQYTTASNSGFITGLSVVLVPIVGLWWGQKMPGAGTRLGIACAVAGLGLLTWNGTFVINVGDFWTLLAAVAFAAHVVMVGYYAPRMDAVALAILQIGIVALAGLTGGLLVEAPPAAMTGQLIWAFGLTSIPATAVALVVQNYMQKFTPPSRTAVIFALEPVFAGLAAWFLLGETLTLLQMGGCVMIVAGMLLSELGS